MSEAMDYVMSKTFAELEAECLAQLEADRLADERRALARLPKAPVLEFPAKLDEAERERQRRVAEQDWARAERRRMEAEALKDWTPLRLTPERYRELCDEAWQSNLEEKAERERRLAKGYHRGVGDPDF
jgi:hypothetical protein